MPVVGAALVTVAREPVRQEVGGRHKAFVDRTALLHPRHEVDRLPRRADLEALAAAVDLVHRVVHRRACGVGGRRVGRVIGAVEAEAEHFAGAGLHRGHHDLHAARIGRRDCGVRHVHHRRVCIQVERRHDLEAALLQQALTVFRRLAKFGRVLDLVHHVIAEIAGVVLRGHAAAAHARQVQRVDERRVHGLLVLLLRDEALIVHQLERDVALLLRLFLILGNRGVVFRRVLRDHGDCGRLHHIEFVRGRVEVPFRRRLHAVERIAAELRDVQVPLQDLLLRVLLLHLHRDEHLAQLARDRVFGGMVCGDRVVVVARLGGEHVLHVLLRQRRTALLVALAHVGLHERAHHALHIHARMLPEALVLAGHHGLHHRFGDVFERHHFAVLRIELRNHGLAVARVHRRFLRQIRHIEVNAFHLHRRGHRFGHIVRAHHRGQEQHAHRHTARNAQGDERERERKHAHSSQGFLLVRLRHADHSKWSALLRPQLPRNAHAMCATARASAASGGSVCPAGR